MSGVMLRRRGSASSLVASASEALPGNIVAPGTARTGYSVVTVFGGQPPYTYAWTEVGAATGVFASHPASSSSRFSYYFTAPGTLATQFKCTVTDALGASVDSNTIDINLEGL